MMNYTENTKYIDIINEFRSLIDFINYKDVIVEKMFQIIEKHFEFQAAGVFFNSPDNLEINTLELAVKNITIDTDLIENKFFQSMSEFKQIIKHKTELHIINRNTKKISVNNELILPFMFSDKLIGGICIFSDKDILKDEIEIFNFIINEFLSIFKLKYIYAEQVFKSSVDGLTGLYNRHQFDISLNQEFNRSQRYNTPFTLAMIDIDHFKRINDTCGHQFGDFVLKEISQIIQHAFRKTDIVYRYGGEEIVILMPETDSEHAMLPLERLRQKISSHDFGGKNVTVSIGVADYKNNNSASEILKSADNMLYQAKNSGRNKIVV